MQIVSCLRERSDQNSFVEEGTSIKRQRIRPNSSTSEFDAVIELDSSSDTDRTPPSPLKIFLSHSKRDRKDVQPLRKRIRAGDVIDLCSSDGDTVSKERDHSSRVPNVPSSKQKTMGMIKSREVIVLSSGDEVEVSVIFLLRFKV